jgi:hypothetical protein
MSVVTMFPNIRQGTGRIYVFQFTDTNPYSGTYLQPDDPDVVTVEIEAADSVKTTYTYGVGDFVTRQSKGVYSFLESHPQVGTYRAVVGTPDAGNEAPFEFMRVVEASLL